MSFSPDLFLLCRAGSAERWREIQCEKWSTAVAENKHCTLLQKNNRVWWLRVDLTPWQQIDFRVTWTGCEKMCPPGALHFRCRPGTITRCRVDLTVLREYVSLYGIYFILAVGFPAFRSKQTETTGSAHMSADLLVSQPSPWLWY